MFKSHFSSLILAGVLSLCGALGCQNYQDQLQRGQGYYEQNQYESALAVFRHLEPDQSQLSDSGVVRYCYLRGMTDFRLGYRTHARYWLGLAQAGGHEKQQALLQDEKLRLEETLQDLNQDVFGAEYQSDARLASEAKKAAQLAEKQELAEKLRIEAAPPSQGKSALGSGSSGGPAFACERDIECQGTQVCIQGLCTRAKADEGSSLPVTPSPASPAAAPSASSPAQTVQ